MHTLTTPPTSAAGATDLRPAGDRAALDALAAEVASLKADYRSLRMEVSLLARSAALQEAGPARMPVRRRRPAHLRLAGQP